MTMSVLSKRLNLTGEILDLGNVDQFRRLDECGNGGAGRLSINGPSSSAIWLAYMTPILMASAIPAFSRFFISRSQRTAQGRRARITSMHPEYAARRQIMYYRFKKFVLPPATRAMISKTSVGQHFAVARSSAFQSAAAGLHWAR